MRGMNKPNLALVYNNIILMDGISAPDGALIREDLTGLCRHPSLLLELSEFRVLQLHVLNPE